MKAAEKGHKEVVELLLSRGADIEAQNMVSVECIRGLACHFVLALPTLYSYGWLSLAKSVISP